MSSNDANSGNPKQPSPVHSTESSSLPTVIGSPSSGAAGLPVGPFSWTDSQNMGPSLSAKSYAHSFRRRWGLAITLGVVLATLTAGILYLVIPLNYEAAAMLRVRRQVEQILPTPGRGNHVTDLDYQTYKQTQSTLIRSPYVLTAALRKEAVSQLEMIREEPNPVDWLSREISAYYPEKSEILRIGMQGENPEELKTVIDSVHEAFMEEIVFAERRTQLNRLDVLKRTYRKSLSDAREKTDMIFSLAANVGTADVPAVEMRQQMAIMEMNSRTGQLYEIQRQFEQTATDFEIRRNILQNRNFEPSEEELENILMSDPSYRTAKDMIRYLKQQIQMTGGGRGAFQLAQFRGRGGAGGVTSPLVRELTMAQNTLKELRKEMIPRMKVHLKMARGLDPLLDQETLRATEIQFNILRNLVVQKRQEVEEQTKRVESLTGVSADLEARKHELETLLEMNKSIKTEIDTLELELQKEQRIRLIQPAVVPNELGNFWWNLVVIGVVWVATFGVIVGGIVFWDCQAQHVNEPSEVAMGTNIRVVGSLPQIDGGQRVWPFGRLVGGSLDDVLTESIDSIRTALLHSRKEDPIQSVMITSATGLEGKTTLAAQLAVSLARSGRRTLLIDADMHNPQQHLVFGKTFDRGFCELLRGQYELEDVIQPVSSEGLWLISTGYCDQASVQALAGEILGKIMHDIRSQFDFIVMDCGPVLTGADPLLLGQYADTTVFSVRRDVSKITKITEASDRLRSVGIPILGAVVNGIAAEVRRTRLQLVDDGPTDSSVPNDNV